MSNQVQRSGISLTRWAIRHPIGTIMISLAIILVGFFSLQRINIDLLPHIIYPDIRVRVLDPGVPAKIMEDNVTRQLEEQLAITEDAIHVESTSSEGRSAVNLSFSYQKDINIALRDASNRLDRAKRFLPASSQAPIIYKRDPFQLPIAEYIVSSNQRDAVDLRNYVDYELSKQLLNLPGVAATEVGGGLIREIKVIVDQERLASLQLDILDIEKLLISNNVDVAAGKLIMPSKEISGRTSGRLHSIDQIKQLPLPLKHKDGTLSAISLSEVAHIIDGAEEEKLRVRFNQLPGIKLSIQKQPQANTVSVVDKVTQQIRYLKAQHTLPKDIEINAISNQATYIKQSLYSASQAAISGALLAMFIVYLFLGNVKRTFVIASVIPIAILVTFILMAATDLTLNIMTLGGLALGTGLLVDNTIVMLENIYRHQQQNSQKNPLETAYLAAQEVSGAIMASTTTNLAAVLPFLLIGGFIGLLFKELIFTISAAIIASLIVALTITPTLAARIPLAKISHLRHQMNHRFNVFADSFASLLQHSMKIIWLIIPLFIIALFLTGKNMQSLKQSFLPTMDENVVSISLTADRGTNLDRMDKLTQRIEKIIQQQNHVLNIYTTVGGFIFGRSQYQSSNRANIKVYLDANTSSQNWIRQTRSMIQQAQIAGLRVYLRSQGIRGIRIGQGDDDVSLRVKGGNLEQLIKIADRVVTQLKSIQGLKNIQHSNEEVTQQLSISIDRERAATYGLSVEEIGQAIRIAINGKEVTNFIQNDRAINISLQLDHSTLSTPEDINHIILFSQTKTRQPIRLSDLARIEMIIEAAKIKRDKQQRIVEITASLDGSLTQREAIEKAFKKIEKLPLPSGYSIYEAGGLETLKKGEDLSKILLGLAIFLVFVVMSVQYESLRNPLIIILSIPFSLIGVNLGLEMNHLPMSMPVWLGLIMLTGIVVNNAIILIEYIEIKRKQGLNKIQAITEAVTIRLRPILMTTLTTTFGMLPLALALGKGSEMLQPLAVTIIAGLLFSLIVSLLLVPMLYQLLGHKDILET